MAVNALGRYEFAPADARENFHGRQLLYVWWEKHRMFSRPFVLALAPATAFRVIVEEHIPDAYCQHPDFPHIDWDRVEWRVGDRLLTPGLDQSLEELGLGHKDLIRFTTPGLEGLNGSGY